MTESPTIRPDGTILNTPGFDAKTGLVYDPNGVSFKIPEEPTQEDARHALNTLLEPFRDFSFASDVYRSANLAALLTALVRPAITGSVPLFSFEAVAQGTGKTLLADLLGIIVTGRRVPHLAQPRDEDEDCKRITSLMVKGARIIFVDNITRRFGHGTLGALITSPVWDDRLLGGNQTGPWDNMAVWFVTGNNMSYHDDLIRRVIPIFMDANMERPEQRTGFTHDRIDEWTQAHRPELVSAALTIVRAYVVADCPEQNFPAYGSFDSWSRWVRSPLVWLGLPDPCEARERIEEEGDTQLGMFAAMLRAWKRCFGREAKTIASAISDADAELLEVLAALAPPKRGNEKVSPLHIGYVFRSYKGRPIGGLRLVRYKDGHANAGAYMVLPANPLTLVGGDGSASEAISAEIVPWEGTGEGDR